MNVLTNNHGEILDEINEKISNIFIDEAHHVEADTWKKLVMLSLNKNSTITATPFVMIETIRWQIIYSFSLKKAQSKDTLNRFTSNLFVNMIKKKLTN